MTDLQQRIAAKRFIETWRGRGDEKQDAQTFWTSLLRDVYGVDHPEDLIKFEVPVKLDHTSYIDALIPSTRVLIEQKGKDIDLKKGIRQSDGSNLTPFGQARRYAGHLPHNENPRWIVVCNFQTFEIHDMNSPNSDPEVVLLEDLENEFYRMNFLTNEKDEHIRKEMKVSLQAGEFVGKLYDLLLKQYNNPASEEELRSLNILCVRLVFCLYAEDAGIFGTHQMFHDYLQGFHSKNVRSALMNLFKVLDTKKEDRDKYMDPDLAAFPYVNGGLFKDEDIIFPPFTDEIVNLLLHNASEEFDWSEISPTIFGAVFESTLNPETRRSGGMHYTSIENIHKVIDPLFLDDLKAEWSAIQARHPSDSWRSRYRKEFHDKLASLCFLDPACGSGNFLTETYLSLRRLENEIIRDVYTGTEGQVAFGQMADEVLDGLNIKVSIRQFYGIEINDFAVTVAKTALWIAESQMLKETEEIVHMVIDFLPLKTYANIIEGNALQTDWETVVPKQQLSYIMGNPPFVGYSLQKKEQKDDILAIYIDEAGNPYKTAGKLDYVSGWYFKAASFMAGTKIRTAFVSTNSITQGEQVAGVWKPLYDRFGIHIDFAHRTFRWDSEASLKAHVHCVIVGFSVASKVGPRLLFTSDRAQEVENINAYLTASPDVFVENRNKPLCSVPEMLKGSSPVDGGNLLLTKEEYDEFAQKEPQALKYIKRFYGAKEFLHNGERWCLWLDGASPAEMKAMPMVMARINATRAFRLASTKAATQKYADYPTRFMELRQPDTQYILVPRHSSENRRYIPFGFMDPEAVCGDANSMIPYSGLYHFGVLISNVHMAWVRAVCGRIKSDYRYSNDVVYNNFPWPTPTESQKAKIEQTAKMILAARAKYPDSSLSDLYDVAIMPADLRTAHQKNDRAVMEAYGFWGKLNTESECVAELMKMYQQLAEKQK